MDTISEARLSLVHPALADKIRRMAEALELEKITIRVTQGLRSWDEQAKLWAQGRTTPGERVTKAPGGWSWHNFGMAVDVAPDKDPGPGFIPDWNLAHPAWGRIVAVGESLGLTSGISWEDEPHLQLTGPFPVAAPNDEVRQLFKDGGMQAVWDEAQLV